LGITPSKQEELRDPHTDVTNGHASTKVEKESLRLCFDYRTDYEWTSDESQTAMLMQKGLQMAKYGLN